LLSLQPV